MADLYFKVKADYDELIKMQQEARRLQGELSDAATKSDFTRLASELQKVNDKIRDIAENGAKNFKDKFKEIGDGTPEFLKEADKAFMEYSTNVVKYLDGIQKQYESMMQELTEKTSQLEQAGNAPKLVEQVKEVTEEVKAQIEVVKLQKEVWNGAYDDSSVSALEIVTKIREEEEKTLEILRQQMEAKKAQAEANKPSLIERASGAVTGFLGVDFGIQSSGAQSQAELEQATQAYETQRQVVEGLKTEEDELRASLSETAQMQVEDAEAAKKAAVDRQAYIEKLRETQGEANKTTDVLDELMNRGGAAAKDLNLETLKNDIVSAQEHLRKLGEELREDIASWKEAQQNLSKMENEMMNNENSKIDPEEIEEARANVEEMRNGVLETADAYDRVDANVQTLKGQINQAAGHQVTLRTQMRQSREELARMVAEGKAGTPEFQQMAIKAGELQRQFRMAGAAMQYFANPQRHLAALKTGLQGVAGAASLVTGTMGLFNTESKKMQQIQTKVQALMAVIVGLETTYNAVKKTSNMMLAVQEVKVLAVAAAHRIQAIGTTEAAVAQEALNAAIRANPFGAILSVIVVLVGAIWSLVEALGGESDAEKAAAESAKYKEEQERKLAETMRAGTNEIEIRKRAEKMMADGVAESVSKQMANYNLLQKKWAECGNDVNKQRQFLHDYEKQLDETGFSIKNVATAHDFLTAQKQKVENYYMAVARAAAAAAAAAEVYKEKLLMLSKPTVENGGKYYSVDSKSEIRIGNPSKQTSYKDKDGFTVDVDYITKEEFEHLVRSGKSSFGSLSDKPEDINDLDWKGYLSDWGAKEINAMRNKAAGELKNAMIKELDARYEYLQNEASKEDKNARELAKGLPAKIEGGKTKGGSGKSSKGGTNKVDHTQSDKDDKEYERQENLRKQALEKEKRDLQNEIKVEVDAEKKREKQRKIAKIESEEFFRDMLKQEIAYQKAQYDEKNKNTNNKVSFYKSQEFHKFMLEEQDKYNDKMKAMNLNAYKNEMEIVASIMEMQGALARSEEYDKNLKELEQFLDKRVQIEAKYEEKRAKIERLRASGTITEKEKGDLIKKVNAEEQAEMDKERFANFKNNPLLDAAMANKMMNFSEIKAIRDEMTGMMNEAMASATPSDFKGILDSYVKITNVMIEKNPFKVMRDSALELKKETADLDKETKALEKLYKDLGTNASGENLKGGRLDILKTQADKAKEAQVEASKEVETAQRQLAESSEAYNSLTPEEQERQRGTLMKLYKDVTDALEKETEAKNNATKASQAYYNERNKVTEQENRVKKSSQKVTATQNANTKATKQAMKVVKEWANALKNVASEFESPIATATAGMADLAVTTLDSIDAIKKSGFAAAKGVEKVAIAVQNAVAILAIIQAAWQVINTIMGLFTGKDKEEYEKHISSLKGQVEALDYTFNRLKEDMDNAWGTEAIEAYTKAVETLNEKQAASLELIKAQSNAHFGHHSLDYYQKKESGITSKELQEAKKKIQELGGDVSGEWITDWLYTLTAEQLREFMSSGIGTLIMGKLGGVNGTGDYSGSDWANDMRAYADTAKTIEDLTLEMTEKLNGISLDGLKDEFKSLVTTMTTSLNDINNSFDAFMREAMYNKLRTKYDEQIEDFNEELKDLNDQYNRGQMSDAEYRKRLQELRDRWKRETKAAQDEYQANLTAAGINATDVEQSATSGGFETMSEDTATELNGRFASMQAMETVTAENTMQLVALQTNAVNIADEIRTIQVNSYLELQAISENTKKIYNTMGEMQGDVKSIKENTDKL